MLKRALRIGKKSTRAFAFSKVTPYFTLRCSKNMLRHPRFSFVVSKKVDKRSVVRNRERRRMSSCIEQIIGQIKPYDMRFSAKPKITMASADNLCALMKNSLKELGAV